MALLKITTTPIEYEMKIERAKFVEKKNELGDGEKTYNHKKSAVQPRTSQQVKAVAEAERSTADFQNLARKSLRGRMVATPVNASIPQSLESLGNVEKMLISPQISTISQAYSDYSVTENFETQIVSDYNYEDYLGAVSFTPQVKDYEIWEMTRKELEFVPGRFHMEITQYPEVSIEYKGGFQYVPKSSDPDYVEPVDGV